MRCTTQSCNRGATAVVEMAVILPFLVLIVLACVDIGRFAYSYIAISNAARAGASIGIMHPITPNTQAAWEAKVRAAAAEEMNGFAGFDADRVVIQTGTDSEGWRWLSVEVPYTFHTVSMFPMPGIPPTGGSGRLALPMRRTVVMRLIRY